MVTLSDLTISVVSHGHGVHLTELLCDLKAGGALGKSRVIVTLNVEDGTFSPCAWQAAGVEFIVNRSARGFGANHNHALKSATSKWLLVVNPDIRLPIGTLEHLMEAAETVPKLGLAAPCVRSISGTIEDSVRPNLSPISVLLRTVRRLVMPETMSAQAARMSGCWVAGMFMLVPRAVFEQVGGFDERFFLYCEDYDLSARIALAGNRLALVAGCSVVHDARRASHRRLRHLWWHSCSLMSVWTSRCFWEYSTKLWLGTLSGVLHVDTSLTSGPSRAGGEG
jgi:GT2 family glycosyltransferase